MTDHFIVVPAIHFGNTMAFLDCVPIERSLERVIVIDNTQDGAIAKVAANVHASVAMRRNAGVAASWNWGVRVALAAGAEFVTLCSTSVRFDDGAQRLCKTADLFAENGQMPWGFESLLGWKMITLGRRTLETVGPFDERFWPAYFEDNDYIWRMRCAGILEPAGADRSLRKIPWIGALDYPVVEDAHAIKNVDGLEVDFVALQAYYELKWGGPPGEELFTEPQTEPIRQIEAFGHDYSYPVTGLTGSEMTHDH